LRYWSPGLNRNWKLPFFTIWTGQQLSHIGTIAGQFALVWWLTRETGSAVVLTTATMVALGPSIVFGPFVGPLIDRWNRKTVIILSDTFIAMVSLWLAYLFWTGVMQVWHIYIVMLLRAFGDMFHGPAYVATIPLMVPKEQLIRVSGMSTVVNGLKGMIGPSLGAVLMELLPLHGVMLVDVVTAAIAVLAIVLVTIPQPDASEVESIRRASYFENLFEGLRFAIKWRGMMILLAGVSIVKIILLPAFSLMPLLVLEHFGKTSAQLGMMQALSGGGAMLGGLVLTAWGGFKKRIHTVLIGFGGLGVAAFVLGILPGAFFWPALGLAALMGIMSAAFNSATSALLQGSIPKHIQGRFFALFGSLVSITSPIGLALAGPFAERFGVPLLYTVGGLVTLALAVIGFFIPSLLSIEEQYVDEDPTPKSTDTE